MYSFAHGKMKFDDLKPVVQRNSTQINNQPAAAPVAPVAAPVAAPIVAAPIVAAPAPAPAAPTPYKAKAVPRDTRHSVNTNRVKPFPEDKSAKTEIKTNAIGDPLPIGPRFIKMGQGNSYGPGIPIMNIARVNRKSN